MRHSLRCNAINLGTDLTGNFLKDSATVRGGEKVPGISHPVFHLSKCASTIFPMQIGEFAAFTVIYHHSGAPRRYTVVPPEKHCELERMLLGFNLGAPQRPPCSQFVSHLQLYIPQSTLKRNNIPFTEVVQYEGEMVVFFPYTYYQGFNTGPNIVEEIAYADIHWKKIHRKGLYKPCNKHCADGEEKFDLSFAMKKYVVEKPEGQESLFVSDGEEERAVESQIAKHKCYRHPTSREKKRKSGGTLVDESDKEGEPKKRARKTKK